MDDYRFWVVDDLPAELIDEYPFGVDTVGIVDEELGGIFLYLHTSNVDRVLEALRQHAGVER